MSFLNFFLRHKISTTNHYSQLEKKINYRFNNLKYLEQAFTHRSISPKPHQNYERLEFLGDSIIDIVVSKALMKEFPEGDEGLLTQKRSTLVQKEFLASMGKLLDLLSYLKIESTVNLDIEKIANKQQANLYESLIGALYLDGGLQPCKELILSTIWTHRIEAWKSMNYKGRLIEYCHSSSLRAPKFQVSNITGPDHQKIFEVHVQIDEKIFPPGMGSNKKTAEQSAAQNTLEILTN